MARKIKNGCIKYVVRKDRNTDRWVLTIHRHRTGWVGSSDTVIQSPSWACVRLYAIDHWTTLKGDGLI